MPTIFFILVWLNTTSSLITDERAIWHGKIHERSGGILYSDTLTYRSVIVW